MEKTQKMNNNSIKHLRNIILFMIGWHKSRAKRKDRERQRNSSNTISNATSKLLGRRT